VSFTYKEEHVELFYADLMTVSTHVENDGDVHRHVRDAQDNLPESSRFGVFKASAKTLNAILTQSESPQLMDLLVLDVEGAELDVLKGLDHDYYRFRWILIESRNISSTTAYLLEKGYVYSNQVSPRDYLFMDINVIKLANGRS